MFNDTANLFVGKLQPTNIPTTCFPKYIVRQCECGRKIFPQGCQKKSCVTCQKHLSARRGSRAYDRFIEYRKKCNKDGVPFVMLYTDFTIPLQLRSKCMNIDYWQNIRKKVWTMLKTHFHAAFALEATHPISEVNPGKFHPHLNFLWCQSPKHKAFIDVNKMRKMFQEILGFYREVNCHHDFTQDPARMVHWCNYVTRVFPTYADWTGALRWYGDYPKLLNINNNICPTCGCAFCTLGWLDHYTVEEYNESGLMTGRPPPWDDFSKLNFFKSKKSKEEVA